MPSNKELIKSITAADSRATTEGLSNNQLVELLASVTAPSVVDGKASSAFTVAAGKSLLTKRGILADGDEITRDDLPGGDEMLQKFVASGYIVEK